MVCFNQFIQLITSSNDDARSFFEMLTSGETKRERAKRNNNIWKNCHSSSLKNSIWHHIINIFAWNWISWATLLTMIIILLFVEIHMFRGIFQSNNLCAQKTNIHFFEVILYENVQHSTIENGCFLCVIIISVSHRNYKCDCDG